MAFFYRFRPAKALLDGHHELERQEIYFCPADALNDPMEGFTDLCWHGDAIVWRNLLKHYLLCFMRAVCFTRVSGKDTVHPNFTLATQRDLPTPELRAIYNRICAAFFALPKAAALPVLFAERPYKVRRDELCFYLRAIHGIAFQAVISVLREANLFPPAAPDAPPLDPTIEEQLDNLTRVLTTHSVLKPGEEEEQFRHLFAASALMMDQLFFVTYSRQSGPSTVWTSLLSTFPERYVAGLRRLVHQEWSTACFVDDPNHAAMWGVYGNGHTGVCLKFRAADNAKGVPTLALRGVNGWGTGGPLFGEITMPFCQVTYADKFPEVDFFRSIGRLPIPVLKHEWYTGDDGSRSACADEMLSGTQEWRKRYWDNFYSISTTKLSDWSHEREYRLMLVSTLIPFDNPEHRKLTYNFSDLEGIVFGLSTPLDDKLAVARIIEKKCLETGRKAFEFSQSVYAFHTGKIETRPLNLLRFA